MFGRLNVFEAMHERLMLNVRGDHEEMRFRCDEATLSQQWKVQPSTRPYIAQLNWAGSLRIKILQEDSKNPYIFFPPRIDLWIKTNKP